MVIYPCGDGEFVFRGTQTLYQSGKGVIRPYPLKTPLLETNFSRKLFTNHFVLSIGALITMLIYWLKVGNSLKVRLILVNFYRLYKFTDYLYAWCNTYSYLCLAISMGGALSR